MTDSQDLKASQLKDPLLEEETEEQKDQKLRLSIRQQTFMESVHRKTTHRRTRKEAFKRFRDKAFDSNIVYTCFNQIDTLCYVFTEEEVYRFTFPEMNPEGSVKGSFKDIRYAQVNGADDLILVLDSEGLKVYRAEDILNGVAKPFYKSDFFVSSASFLVNDDILVSTMNPTGSDVNLRRLVKQCPAGKLVPTTYKVSEKVYAFNFDLEKIADLQKSNSVKVPSYAQNTWGPFIPMAQLPSEQQPCAGPNYFKKDAHNIGENDLFYRQYWETKYVFLCHRCLLASAEYIMTSGIYDYVNEEKKEFKLIRNPLEQKIGLFDCNEMKIVAHLDYNVYTYACSFKALSLYDRTTSQRHFFKINLDHPRPGFNSEFSFTYERKKEIYQGIQQVGSMVYFNDWENGKIEQFDTRSTANKPQKFKDHIDKYSRFYRNTHDDHICVLSKDKTMKIYQYQKVQKTTNVDAIYVQNGDQVASDLSSKQHLHCFGRQFATEDEFFDLERGSLKKLKMRPNCKLLNVIKFDFPDNKDYPYPYWHFYQDELDQKFFFVQSNLGQHVRIIGKKFTEKFGQIRYKGTTADGIEFLALDLNESDKLYLLKLTKDYDLQISQYMDLNDNYYYFELTKDRQEAILANNGLNLDIINIVSKDISSKRTINTPIIDGDYFQIIGDDVVIYQSEMKLIKKNYKTNEVIDAFPVSSKRIQFKPIYNDYLALIQFSYSKETEDIYIVDINNFNGFIKLNFGFGLTNLDIQENDVFLQREDFSKVVINMYSDYDENIYGLDQCFNVLKKDQNFSGTYKYGETEVIYFDDENRVLAYTPTRFDEVQNEEIMQINMRLSKELNKNDDVLVQEWSKEIKKDFMRQYPDGSILNKVAKRPLIVEQLMKTLQLQISDKSKIPFLMQKNSQGESPLDIAVRENQTVSINLMIEMMDKFYDNPNSNYIIDHHFCSLVNKGINLVEYFDSSLPMYIVRNPTWPSLHNDSSELIVGAHYKNIRDLEENYDKIFNELEPFDDQAQQVPIEYHVVNLPDTLTGVNPKDPKKERNPKELMNSLLESDQIELYEAHAIQTIIAFKWQTYTYNFFSRQFYIFCGFVFFVLVDIFLSLFTLSEYHTKMDKAHVEYDEVLAADIWTTYLISGAIVKVICMGFLSFFVKYEITSAIKEGWRDYFSEFWNFFDYMLFTVYILSAYLSYFGFESKATLQFCYSFLTILTFLKVCFFMRIYDGFSFLVSMIQGVFFDLKYFMGFYLLVLALFTVLYSVLTIKLGDAYTGVEGIAYFLMSFRTSTGDFEVDDYKNLYKPEENTGSFVVLFLAWLIWLVAVIILNIVFMNFIIAVISESYEKIMQKLVSQTYKVKVDLIKEREMHMSTDELQDPNYFPRYIVVRKPTQNAGVAEEEWQGFVRDLKMSLKTSNARLSQLMTHLTERSSRQVQQLTAEIRAQEVKIMQIDGSNGKKMENIESKISTIGDGEIEKIKVLEENQDKKLAVVKEQQTELLQKFGEQTEKKISESIEVISAKFDKLLAKVSKPIPAPVQVPAQVQHQPEPVIQQEPEPVIQQQQPEPQPEQQQEQQEQQQEEKKEEDQQE